MLDILPDLFDDFASELHLLVAPWRQYGGQTIFYGEVVTVRCFEDNSKVKEILATPGHRRVLLVDGAASLSKALLGDLIAQSAVDNDWAGIVILGAVRDVATLKTLPIGIQALGHVPIKTKRLGLGDVNIQLSICGIDVQSGDWLYADDNGIAISRKALPLAL